jgi:PAS domain S-box-containing protein
MRPVHAAAAAAVAGAAAAGVALVRASARSLGAAEERFRRVFEDSPTGMALADLDLCILEANASFGRFLGIPAAELVGRSVASYSHPEDMALTLEHHRGLLAGTAGHYRMEKRAFANMTEDPRAAALVQAVVTMAASLDLTVVAEGIETEAQREALVALGCRYGQGYLFGRPQPAFAPAAQIAAA